MKNLHPAELWRYFDEILKIPRLSKNEEKILDYLKQFAVKNKLDIKNDNAGNCLITKPATKGYEERQTIILQSHVDMVGEKLLDVDHDFKKDAIKAVEAEGWIMAEGTTLGADDGIGVAASLAILADDRLDHGPLECLFTVEEETGMTGAFGIEEGFMKGKILFNLDSEDEGEIFIGCAGGIDTIGAFQKEMIPVGAEKLAFQLILEGLQGGHSGDEIHKGFANAIKLMNRILWELSQAFGINISKFEGGKLRNAIPREASAVVVVKKSEIELVKLTYTKLVTEISKEIREVEPGFKITLEEIDLPRYCFSENFQQRLLDLIYNCPHGVIGWNEDIEGLVETSSNLAILREIKEGYTELVTSQRSSSESAKRQIAEQIAALFIKAKGEVRHSSGYPGWKPNKDSEILAISLQVYRNLFKKDPEVKAIHAGLECGLFLQKYPYLDMISFGPTIKGAHTPEEKIEIKSVLRFWEFLLALLKNAPVVSQVYSMGSKSPFETPHTGQDQFSGISSKAVPGGIPESGSPSTGS